MNKKLARVIAAGAIVGGAMIPAAAAHAAYGDPGSGGQGGSDPGSSSGSGSGSGDLPFTGGDVAGLALIGVTLAAGGTALVRMNRRRAAF